MAQRAGVAITLGCIVALSVWGRLRLMALLVAMCVGVALAALLGRMEERRHAAPGTAAGLAWPGGAAMAPGRRGAGGGGPGGHPHPARPLGNVIMLDKMDDADWKRADMQAVGKGIRPTAWAIWYWAWRAPSRPSARPTSPWCTPPAPRRAPLAWWRQRCWRWWPFAAMDAGTDAHPRARAGCGGAVPAGS